MGVVGVTASFFNTAPNPVLRVLPHPMLTTLRVALTYTTLETARFLPVDYASGFENNFTPT